MNTITVSVKNNGVTSNYEVILKESGKFIIGHIPLLDIDFHGLAGSDIGVRASNMIKATLHDA